MNKILFNANSNIYQLKAKEKRSSSTNIVLPIQKPINDTISFKGTKPTNQEDSNNGIKKLILLIGTFLGLKSKKETPEIESENDYILPYKSKIVLKNLKLGKKINSGKYNNVYEILDQPNLVARVDKDSDFKPENLSYHYNNPYKKIIAATPNNFVQIMEKINGKPLYGKNWSSKRVDAESFFIQLKQLESVPDEAFIKYYYDLLEIRKNGYDLDTVNPNNILYDEKEQKFNFVDISLHQNWEGVNITDFYPFINGAEVGTLYNCSTPEIQKKITQETRAFLHRIENIGNKIGVDLSGGTYYVPKNYIPYYLSDLY